MGVSDGSSKVSTFVAAICIAIYVMAIASGVVQIIENIGERRNLAEKEFFELTDRASSSAVFLGFMSEAYQETIRDFLSGSETLTGIIITSSGAEYAFERSPGSAIVWAGYSPRFKNAAGLPLQPFYLPLRIEGQRNVTIQAVYSRISSDTFLRVLRNTLLAVLVSLAIALITLMIGLARKNKTVYYRAAEPDHGKRSKVTPNADSQMDSAPVFSDPSFSSPSPSAAAIKGGVTDDDKMFSVEEQSDTDSPFGDISFPEEDEDGDEYKEDVQADDSSEEELPEKDEDIPVDIEPEDSSPEDNNPADDNPADISPTGLFSPKSNIGWESYTRDRLTSELHRCASSEQDLVFLAMEFKDIDTVSDALYRQLSDEAVACFGLRDLIFEKGEKGIAVIYPNVDLESGIAKSEEFRSRIIAKLVGFYKGNVPDIDFCVGLSSRSGRLIEADRLTFEAFTALEKAKEDPASPVVAFKSNPEKYREFLKSHTA